LRDEASGSFGLFLCARLKLESLFAEGERGREPAPSIEQADQSVFNRLRHRQGKSATLTRNLVVLTPFVRPRQPGFRQPQLPDQRGFRFTDGSHALTLGPPPVNAGNAREASRRFRRANQRQRTARGNRPLARRAPSQASVVPATGISGVEARIPPLLPSIALSAPWIGGRVARNTQPERSSSTSEGIGGDESHSDRIARQ